MFMSVLEYHQPVYLLVPASVCLWSVQVVNAVYIYVDVCLWIPSYRAPACVEYLLVFVATSYNYLIAINAFVKKIIHQSTCTLRGKYIKLHLIPRHQLLRCSPVVVLTGGTGVLGIRY